MRISKFYPVVCAAALCTSIAVVRADDNPAQAAARAALEEQMRAMDTQQANTNTPSSAPAAPAQPAPPAAATAPVENPPAAQTPAAAATPAAPVTPSQPVQPAAVPPVSPPPSAVAVTPSGATMPTNPPPASTMPASTPPAVTAVPATSSSGNSLFGPVPPPSGGATSGAAIQESMPAPMTTTPTATQIPAPAVAQPVSMEPSPNNNSAAIPSSRLGLQPMVAPPLPISPTQQAQLQALLEQYNNNAISAVQYQAARQKILAEPR